MAENSFKTTVFALVLVCLFGMLLITAIVDVGNSYSKDTSQIAGGSLAIAEFNDSISDFSERTQSLEDRFEKGSVWSVIAGVVVEGIFGIAIDIFKIILTPFNVFLNIMTDVLHVPIWVSSIVLGIFILSVIFAIWRLIKIGD